MQYRLKKNLKINLRIVCVLLSLCGFANAQNVNSFQNIDSYARKCPASATQTISTLAEYLQKCCSSDIEKARVIYVWIAENIRYDSNAYNTGVYNDCSAEEVLRLRKSVCEGFSNLFLSLGLKMNLEIRKVSGYAKGYSYTSGVTLNKTNHAWNSIKINGNWRLFDVTWGQGYGYTNNSGKLACVKQFSDFWFDTDPYAFVFSHLPEDINNSLIDKPIGLTEFSKLPNLNTQDFQHGIPVKDIFQYAMKQKDMTLPLFYSSTPKNMKIIKIPLSYNLQKGEKYHFEFVFPTGKNIFLKDSLYHSVKFKKQDYVFSLDYIPTCTGKITIETEQLNDEGMQMGYMRYNVR